MINPVPSLRPAERRWMLLRGFIAQNAAVGCAFGGFGVSILPLQEKFGAGRGIVSMGLSLVVLMIGLMGPLVAAAAARFGLRAVMVAGCIICGAGYVVLSRASSIEAVLVVYALMIGPGVAMSGTLPASLLAGNWYPEARGRAVGIATMPVLLAFAPIAGQALIHRFGLPNFYLALAAFHLVSLPLLLGIREARPVAAKGAEPHSGGHAAPVRTIVRRPLFWVAVIGAALLNATGIIGSIHLVAVIVERGMSTAEAALLASVMGGASVLGAAAVGWLCDRLGGAWALTLVAASFGIGWSFIAFTGWPPLMFLAIVLIGVSGPGVFPCVSLLLAHAFGAAALPRAMALSGMLSLPFTFLLPTAAGWLHDMTGDYRLVMATIVLVCGLVAMLFSVVGRRDPHNAVIVR